MSFRIALALTFLVTSAAADAQSVRTKDVVATRSPNSFIVGPTDGCRVHDRTNLFGSDLDIKRGARLSTLPASWDNLVSSLACATRCTLTGYDQPDFRGDRIAFSGRVNFVGSSWNDRFSSIEVTCKPGGAS